MDELLAIVDEVNTAAQADNQDSVCHLLATEGYAAIVLDERALWDTADENDGEPVSLAKVADRLVDYANELLTLSAQFPKAKEDSDASQG